MIDTVKYETLSYQISTCFYLLQVPAEAKITMKVAPLARTRRLPCSSHTSYIGLALPP
jgi:hypothetical protein